MLLFLGKPAMGLCSHVFVTLEGLIVNACDPVSRLSVTIVYCWYQTWKTYIIPFYKIENNAFEDAVKL